MVEQKNGNKLRRHIAIALLPTAALLLGSSAAFATNSIDQKGPSTFAIGGTGGKGRAIGGTGSDAIGGTGLTADAIGGTGRAKGRAIGGTGSDAIGGTGADAIGGTGLTADAIGGTGRAKGRAIGGTGSDAIGGTGVDVDAIGGTGGKGRAIGGTGADAIGGTGLTADAIGGTGRAKGRAIGGTGSDAIGGTGRGQLMLLGPIDSVDQARGTITVLGRKFQLPTGQAGAQILNSYASGVSLQIAVLGTLSTSGKIANLHIQVLRAPYVPGVSEIVLTGIVQALDVTTGLVVINGVAVDYNSLLQTRVYAMRVGNIVTVRGTMPQAGQAINASVLVIHGR